MKNQTKSKYQTGVETKLSDYLFLKPLLALLIFISPFINNNSLAQTPQLWGMTSQGGSYKGNIFKITGDSTGFNSVYDFDSSGGLNPMGNLIQASNGLLYGVAQNGGSLQKGVIFSYNPTTNSYNNIADFDGVTGEQPLTSLYQASNGLLYGKCMKANPNYYNPYDSGYIYIFNPNTAIITYLKTFAGISPEYYGGSLMQASDSMLYGMSVFGGTYSKGTLFRYNITTDSLSILENFDSVTIGGNPWGTLLQASNGLLYGLCKNGGTLNWGNIFSYDINLDTLIVLYNFTGIHGLNPDGTLIEAATGIFYGLLQGSFNIDTSGNIFSFDPITNEYSPLYAFHHSGCGHPWGSPILSPDGWLYGMTFYGGPDSSGVIFKYNPIDSTYINVYEFDSTHGVHPRVDLFLANNGKMYGITTTGGAYSNGVIFSLDTTTNAYTDEYDFHDNTDGNYPYGSLFQASNGMMYGMTNQGGTNNVGIIFNINPVTN